MRHSDVDHDVGGVAARHRRVNDRGVAAVEFAIVLMPLLLILLGIVEFGRVYSLQLNMQYAAREGARAIALDYDDPGMTSTLLTGQVDSMVSSLLPISQLSDLHAHSIQLCSTAITGPQTAIVQLEDRLDLAIPLPDAMFNDVPVRARAQMPCEG